MRLRVSFMLYSTIYNDVEKRGTLARYTAPEGTALNEFTAGFWVDECGRPITGLTEVGDVFIPAHQILSIEKVA